MIKEEKAKRQFQCDTAEEGGGSAITQICVMSLINNLKIKEAKFYCTFQRILKKHACLFL
jgi:hypothetical protein